MNQENVPDSPKLIPRHINYANLLHKGINQSIAYKEAGYSTDNQTPETLASNASRLANSVKVKAYLTELQSQSTDDTVATVKERKQVLTKLIRHNHEEVTPRDTILATAELNKIERVYETRPQSLNNVFVINVPDVKTKGMLERLVSGNRYENAQDEQERLQLEESIAECGECPYHTEETGTGPCEQCDKYKE